MDGGADERPDDAVEESPDDGDAGAPDGQSTAQHDAAAEPPGATTTGSDDPPANHDGAEDRDGDDDSDSAEQGRDAPETSERTQIGEPGGEERPSETESAGAAPTRSRDDGTSTGTGDDADAIESHDESTATGRRAAAAPAEPAEDAEATGGGHQESAESQPATGTPGAADRSAATGRRTKGPDEKFCSSCGEIVKQAAEICPECGVRQADAPSVGQQRSQRKDPGVAALLSAITGGWGGQLYNGQIAKGLALLALQFVNLLLTLVLVGFLTGLIVWIVGIYDAYNAAQKINERERSP